MGQSTFHLALEVECIVDDLGGGLLGEDARSLAILMVLNDIVGGRIGVSTEVVGAESSHHTLSVNDRAVGSMDLTPIGFIGSIIDQVTDYLAPPPLPTG